MQKNKSNVQSICKEDNNTPNCGIAKKVLLIDGNNVVRDFMDCIRGTYFKDNIKIPIPHENRVNIDLSNLIIVEKRVEKFLKMSKEKFKSVKVFYDVNRKSDEVIEKYKSRRAYDIEIEFRGVLYGHSIVLADMFKKYGAEINYCWDEDADDTIASFASDTPNSVIYSKDKDYMRYNYNNIPDICSIITYENGFLEFKRNFVSVYGFTNGTEKDIIYPRPKTSSDEGKLKLIMSTKKMLIGVPTELCKEFGNFGARIKEFRRAVYYQMFGDSNIKIKEEYPQYNKEDNKVEWITEYVSPSNKYLRLVKYNPHKAFNLLVSKGDIYKYRKYIYNKYKDNKRRCINTKFHNKSSAKEIAFNNCFFSLYCSIIAQHCFLNNNASFLDKIYEIYFKEYKCDFCNNKVYLDIPSQWKKNKNKTNLITCYKCSQVCYYWRCGYCKSDDDCKFKHESVDFNRACPFNDNCKNKGCKYLHKKLIKKFKYKTFKKISRSTNKNEKRSIGI
jgi:hypothetical protein